MNNLMNVRILKDQPAGSKFINDPLCNTETFFPIDRLVGNQFKNLKCGDLFVLLKD